MLRSSGDHEPHVDVLGHGPESLGRDLVVVDLHISVTHPSLQPCLMRVATDTSGCRAESLAAKAFQNGVLRREPEGVLLVAGRAQLRKGLGQGETRTFVGNC